MKELEFYFDYLSPYAYFAWHGLERLCQDQVIEVTFKPVVFGKLLDYWGQLGPAEIPPKREWLMRYCLFYARRHRIPIAFPAVSLRERSVTVWRGCVRQLFSVPRQPVGSSRAATHRAAV